MGHPFSTYAKFSKKKNISYHLIRTPTYAYQGVRHVSFSENVAYILNGWPLMRLQGDGEIRKIWEWLTFERPCHIQFIKKSFIKFTRACYPEKEIDHHKFDFLKFLVREQYFLVGRCSTLFVTTTSFSKRLYPNFLNISSW